MGKRNGKLEALLNKKYGPPAINLKDFRIDTTVLNLVPKEIAEKYTLIPVNRAGPSLIVAISTPSNTSAFDELKLLTGCNIEPVVASEAAIKQAIATYYGD